MTRQYPITMASVLAWLVIGATPGLAWAQTGHNILMIIADDVGVDMIGAYQEYEGSTDVPPTPEIDSLAAKGIQFLNTWSNPMCATTRATIQTGRYSHRTGVTGGSDELPDEEFSIAEILSRDAALDYASPLRVRMRTVLGGAPLTAGFTFFPSPAVPRRRRRPLARISHQVA